jgi:hypothetical protein
MDKFRGHNIEQANEAWIFSDNKETVAETWQSRPCGHCNLMNTPEEYDGCLGHIPGALNACCGHGNDDEAYIQFEDKTITGKEVKEYLNRK